MDRRGPGGQTTLHQTRKTTTCPPLTQSTNTPSTTQTKPPSKPKLGLWWLWGDSDNTKEWKGDTEQAWKAKLAVCQFEGAGATLRSNFLTKAGITAESTGAALRDAVLNSTPGDTPPTRLLNLTYAPTFTITQLTGYHSKRDSQGERRSTWLTHWAPTTVLAAHAAACHNLGLPVASDKPSSDTHHLLTWEPLRLPEDTIQRIMGKHNFEALSKLKQTPIAQPPPPQKGRPPPDLS